MVGGESTWYAVLVFVIYISNVAAIAIMATCLMVDFVDWLCKKAIRKNDIIFINKIRKIRGFNPLDLAEWDDESVRNEAAEISDSIENRLRGITSK